MRNRYFILSIVLLLSIPLDGYPYDFLKNNFIPPFILSGDTSSILLICDTSGSMDRFAYAKCVTGKDYNPDKIYFGYFDSYAYYKYVKCLDSGDSISRSGFFEENPKGWKDSTGAFHGYYDGNEDGTDNVKPEDSGAGSGRFEWSGNFLNYIYMRRMELLKLCLTGGRRASDNFGKIIETSPAGYESGSLLNPLNFLVVGDSLFFAWDPPADDRAECSDIKCKLPPGPSEQEPEKPDEEHFLTPYGKDGKTTLKLEYQIWYNNRCGTDKLRPFYIKFCLNDIPKEDSRKLLALKIPATERPEGLIQQAGRDVRFGLMRLNRDGEGGRVLTPVGNREHLCKPASISCASECKPPGTGSDNLGGGFRMQGIIKAVNDLAADGDSPLGEALATAVQYFRQKPALYHSDDFKINKEWDPFFINKDLNQDCSIDSAEGEHVQCSKSFVLIFTDGEATRDSSIPGWIPDSDGNDGLKGFNSVVSYARTENLFKGEDNRLNLRLVSLSETCPEKLKSPDCFFKAENGYELLSNLITGSFSISKRPFSGTSPAMITDSEKGTGTIFQSFFAPEITDSSGTERVAWAGFLHALFIDRYGNICEDTDQDGKLIIPGDRIINFAWDKTDSILKVNFFASRLPDGRPDPDSRINTGKNATLKDIKSVWEAGRILSEIPDKTVAVQREYSSPSSGRYIFTWADINNNGAVDTGEIIPFDKDHSKILEPWFGLPVQSDPDYISAEDLIKWIRGEDLPGFRSRRINFNGKGTQTWRLGDIVYSTPTVAASPAEALDLIYGDPSYRKFYAEYKNRRLVVYAGANDGMLHAFNGGFRDEKKQACSKTSGSRAAFEPGQELWAFIPFDLLPHLQALPQTDYDPDYGRHVAFVDQKPKIMDVRFSNGSWHTILVCGMRMGGGETRVNGDTLKSSFFALDITDPEKPPVLLWSFNDTHGTSPAGSNHLGFTTSYPAMVNLYDKSSGELKNYIIFGSGPTTINRYYDQNASNYPVKSNQNGRMFAIDIETGAPELIRIETAPDSGSYAEHLPEKFSYFGSSAAVDIDYKVEEINGKQCYASELLYAGMAYDDDNDFSTPPRGKIYRLKMIKPDGSPATNPADWEMSLLCDVNQPVTAAPNIQAASLRSGNDEHKVYVKGNDRKTESYRPVIYFGTGELWFPEDNNNRTTQSFYGIAEPVVIVKSSATKFRYQLAWGRVEASELMDTGKTKVYANGWVDMDGSGSVNGAHTGIEELVADLMKVNLKRSDSEPVNNPDNNFELDHFSRFQGWKSDLDKPGERVLGQSAAIGGVIIHTSCLPSDNACTAGGESFFYSRHYLTGTPSPGALLSLSATDYIFEDGKNYYSIEKSIALGKGLSLTPSLKTGWSANSIASSFVQTDTCEIKNIKTPTLLNVLPPGVHVRSWKEDVY